MSKTQPAFTWRGVLFDMDGVLCDSGPFLYAATARMFRERYGVAIRQEDGQPYFGCGEVAYISGAGRAHGIEVRMPQDLEQVYGHYFSSIAGSIKPFPGVLDFVAAASRHGLRLAVASSADRRKVLANLSGIGLPAGRFDAVVTVEDVQKPKPAPDIFLLAAARIGLPPTDCLVVEDAPSGIRAARAAGCPCLAVTNSFGAGELLAAGADYTTDAMEWLRTLALFTRDRDPPRGGP